MHFYTSGDRFFNIKMQIGSYLEKSCRNLHPKRLFMNLSVNKSSFLKLIADE